MIRSLALPVRWFVVASAVLVLASALGRFAARATAAVDERSAGRGLPITGAAALLHPPSAHRGVALALGDSLLGASGKLRARLVPMAELARLAGLVDTSDGRQRGVYQVIGGVEGKSFAVLPLRPFSLKTGAFVGSYRMGYWPAERRAVRLQAYQNPRGFIEVTPANAGTRISEHFLLRDFLTHDQPDIWPKYLVLRETLLDKLELVLADLALSGHATSRVIVLSGFRTPAHNLALGDASGRARESRHQFGDAADIIIDSNADGRMDDLDLDGRSDVGDVRVIERSVERVERAHPELVGGLGLYQAMGPSGPFAHIDVRGEPARWTSSRARRVARVAPTRAMPVSHCQATGASAVLCSVIRRRAR